MIGRHLQRILMHRPLGTIGVPSREVVLFVKGHPRSSAKDSLRLGSKPAPSPKLPLAVALAAVLALSACSSKPDLEPREMWEGVRYDRPLTVDELVDLGWRCGRDTFSVADDYDSACGTRIDPANNPFFTVFGVPHAGSTVFLKQGRLKGMNIGIHATSAELVASHMARIFGRPDVLANPIGCDLHWSVRGTEYRLELSDGTQDAFVSLFVQLGSRLPDGETLGFGTRLWKKITGSPCGRFP